MTQREIRRTRKPYQYKETKMDQDIIDGALKWIALHMEDDPDADIQALAENIIRWRSAATMGRYIKVDFDEFREGVLRVRYGVRRGIGFQAQP